MSSARSIEVLEFVPLESVDPIYFDRSYLKPQRSAVKPYLLLRDALAKYDRVAIAEITLRQHESLALLRVYADLVLLDTMLWRDEVRQPDFQRERRPLRPPELDLAGLLIDAKVAGREVTTPPPETTGAPATDLTSALRASVEAASRNRQRTGSVAASGSVAALRPS